MTNNCVYDVAIIGGGLAGLALARQLHVTNPNLNVCVLERRVHPTEEACHKVGESSVEIGAHYFGERLQLKQHIETEQLPKFGLRFFFPSEGNQEVTSRFEIGPSIFPKTPSYQLDRGRFENHLFELGLQNGQTMLDQCTVNNVLLSGVDLPENAPHQIQYKRNGEKQVCEANWIVDASGRFSILKRKLHLEKPVNHKASAVWFRIKAIFDIDTWSNNAAWRKRIPAEPRRLSTNHFMGKGYWLWFIPLASGYTSVGLVFDDSCHDLNQLRCIEDVMKWLHQHEPDCAGRIEPELDKMEDFKYLKSYAHGCQQVYSSNRWCITGEAGVFVDPFYSPGSDLIAMSNDYICELITRSKKGENIDTVATTFNRLYLQIFEVILLIYEGLYPQFGNAQIMKQKILWDSAIYLGVTSLLYFNRKFTDLNFMQKISSSLSVYNRLNYRVQTYLKHQPVTEKNAPLDYGFLNLSQTDFFGFDLNQQLKKTYSTDEALIETINKNIRLLETLAEKIMNNQNIGPAVAYCIPKSMPVEAVA